MGAFENGLLHKALLSHSKANLLLFLIPLLVLIVALMPHWETLMPTMWHAFAGFSEGPIFAFLLLNCLILTIIASSKLESEKGGHEGEASTRESMRQMEKLGAEKGALIGREDVMMRRGRGAQSSHDSSLADGYGSHYIIINEEQDCAGGSISCSLNANYDDQKQIIKQEPITVHEKKPRIMRASACTEINHDFKPLKEKKLIMRGSSSFHHTRSAAADGSPAKPPLQKSYSEKKLSIKRAGHIVDHPSRQAEPPPASAAAAMAHPSLEDVWAAIMLTKSDDHPANHIQTPDQQSNYGNDNQALAVAAARTPPAAAVAGAPTRPPAAAARSPPAAAAAAPANRLRRAQAAPNPAAEAPAAARKDQLQELDGDDRGHESELEELNRRAEEFIARFNHQVRLQRQESMQRKRRHRPCNQQYPTHLQAPGPGLLVG